MFIMIKILLVIIKLEEKINKNISSKPPFKLKDFYEYVLSNQNLLNHNFGNYFFLK